MATHGKLNNQPVKQAAATSAYKDTYQEVTNQVIELLEQGTAIWQCTWNEAGLPKNITTKIPYRGWNVFWLNFYTLLKGYSAPDYLTYKQAQALGGNIRKGEKGTQIIYWAEIKLKSNTDNNEEQATASNNEGVQLTTLTRMVPKVHTVFNIEQAEGLSLPEPALTFKSKVERIEACENVIADMPDAPTIITSGSKAYYMPHLDTVVVPNLSSFKSSEEYYSTLFHELAHSTGHLTRLNRKELINSDGFGSPAYAKEELTAEMSAAFLCAITGIGQPTINNSAAYISNWLQALRNDKTLVLKAATQAQRACDYILNVSDEAS